MRQPPWRLVECDFVYFANVDWTPLARSSNLTFPTKQWLFQYEILDSSVLILGMFTLLLSSISMSLAVPSGNSWVSYSVIT